MYRSQGSITIRRRPKDGTDGKDGKDGQSAVRLDLSNQNVSMLYDAEGNLLSGSVTTQATLYVGDTAVLPAAVSWYISEYEGCTSSQVSLSALTGIITVTGINASGHITVQATYGGITYSAVLSLLKIVGTVKYDLDVSPNAVAYNSTTGTKSASAIVIRVRRTAMDASGGVTASYVNSVPNGYVSVDGEPMTSGFYPYYSHPVDVSRDAHVIELYANSVRQDIETVPINKSANGTDGKDGNGISNIYIHYGVSASGINPPAYWSPDIPEVAQGQYLWTRTTIVYTDTTKANKVSYTVAYMGKDGIGEPGLPGCIYRRTVWETGKTYRNDKASGETAEDGLRYIDVCLDTDIALIGSDIFNMYICRQTHTSSDAIPLAEGAYWQETNSSAPIATALVLTRQIIADYIDVASIAAKQAFIEALTVNKLATSSKAISKRILINDGDLGYLQVFDGTDERVRVSAEAVEGIDDLIETTTRGSGTRSATVTPTTPPSAYYEVQMASTTQFALTKGTFALKDTVVSVTLPLLTSVDGTMPDWLPPTAIIELWSSAGTSALMVWETTAKDLTRGTSNYTTTVRVTTDKGYTLAIPPPSTTKYYLKLKLRVTPNGGTISSSKTVSATYTLKSAFITNGRMTAIGNNGLYSVWGVNSYVFITADNDIQMRNGAVGIDLKGGAIALTLDNIRYTVSTASAKDTDGSTIKVLKLTQST